MKNPIKKRKKNYSFLNRRRLIRKKNLYYDIEILSSMHSKCEKCEHGGFILFAFN